MTHLIEDAPGWPGISPKWTSSAKSGIGTAIIYEATDAAQISFEMMEVLGTNGIRVFTGIPGIKGPMQVDADKIMRNLVTL